jgi:DNA-binding response OmpR family regulator
VRPHQKCWEMVERTESLFSGLKEAQGEMPILIVEDDWDIRSLVQMLLEDEGFAVETVADGRQALEWVAQRQPAMLILDMNLPFVDGFGVAAGLRAVHGEQVPIVTLTADSHGAEKARRVGAAAFLGKPFDIDMLIGEVHRVIATEAGPD